jgi:hypothetical protein
MRNEYRLADGDKLTIFRYLYRDAGNYKSHGSVLLHGELSIEECAKIEAKMESGEFFIAEQIGVRTLYEGLYGFSNGITEQDHVWHCFEGFQESDAGDETLDLEHWGTVNEFKEMFLGITEWNLQLSKHA